MVGRLDGLDALRGMAALAVLVFHTVVLLQLWPSAALPFTFNYLSLAVQLFFSLSAFSLCVGYFGSLSNGPQLVHFWGRRCARIAPLFYFVLGLYMARRLLMGWPLPPLNELVSNIAFIFSVVPGYHESLVPAGWSIGVEMVFYAMFPALMYICRNIRSSVIVWVLSFATSVGSASLIRQYDGPLRFDWMNPIVQLPYFIAGILTYHIFKLIEGRRFRYSPAIFAVAIAMIWTAVYQVIFGPISPHIWKWPLDRHILGTCIMPIVLLFALAGTSILVNKVTVYIGKISYGVYLLHPFVITVVGTPVWKRLLVAGYTNNSSKVGMIFLITAATIAFASATYYLLERPCTRVGASVNRRARVVTE